MKNNLSRVVLMLLGALAINYLVWQWLGLISVVMCAPLYAMALARPLLELMTQGYQWTRLLAYREISGRHFEHRGFAMDIVEDEDGYRWLRIDDVRKIIPALPSAPSLKHRFPGGVQLGPAARIKTETLAVYLAKSTDSSSLKFKHWLEKVVALPARQIRERHRAALPHD